MADLAGPRRQVESHRRRHCKGALAEDGGQTRTAGFKVLVENIGLSQQPHLGVSPVTCEAAAWYRCAHVTHRMTYSQLGYIS